MIFLFKKKLSFTEKYTRYLYLVELLSLELGMNNIVLNEIWEQN